MVGIALCLLLGSVGGPRLGLGDATVLERTDSSLRIEWQERRPDGASADRTLVVALPAGTAPPAVHVSVTERVRSRMPGAGSPEPAAVRVLPVRHTPAGRLLPLRVDPTVARAVIRIALPAAIAQDGQADLPPTLPPDALLPRDVDIAVAATGLVRVTAEDLDGLWPGEIPVDRIALRDRAGPVAVDVLDADGDGLLGPGEAVEFHGLAGTTRYDARRVYRLSLQDPSSPDVLRMEHVDPPNGPALADPVPATAVFEQRLRYFLNVRNGEEDNFYWASVSAPAGWSTSFDLPGAVAGSAGTLSVALQGLTSNANVDPDHHVTVAVNGTSVGDLTFDGVAAVTASFAVPPGVLVAAGNQLTLGMPGDTGASSDLVLLDRFVLDYRRAVSPAAGEGSFAVRVAAADVFEAGPFGTAGTVTVLDVSVPSAPRRQDVVLSPDGSGGWRGIAGGFGAGAADLPVVVAAAGQPPASITLAEGRGLVTDRRGADLLIVAPRAFDEAVGLLAARRRAQGLRVRIVRTEEALGAFSGGELDPAGIRALVSFAVAEWEAPALRHVLLLGDGTFDYRHDLPGTTPFENGTFVPVALYDSDFNETATDNWFVDFDDDLLPELSIGRIPAASPEEALRAVRKILDYEDRPFGVGFETRALLVADDVTQSWEQPYFEQLPDELEADFSPYMQVRQLRVGTMPAADLKGEILEELERGAVWVNYIGHGSVRSWAQEQILSTADTPLLGLVDRPAFFVTMTCSNGLFQFPNVGPTGNSQRSLAETAMVETDAGAIAFLAPTNPTLADPLPELNHAVLRSAFDGSVVTLGEIVQAAKRDLDPFTVGAADLLRGLVLFGDPSMSLRNNRDPIPVASVPNPAPTGAWAFLDGSGSNDPDRQAITHRWSIVGKPEGSISPLRKGDQPVAEFWPDRAGIYVFSLVVGDGYVEREAIAVLEAEGPDRGPPGEGCACRMDGNGRRAGWIPALAACLFAVGLRRRRARRIRPPSTS